MEAGTGLDEASEAAGIVIYPNPVADILHIATDTPIRNIRVFNIYGKKIESIRRDVKVRYAYYASDNPLETGSTLASGGLGLIGVKPTYLITYRILEQIGRE